MDLGTHRSRNHHQNSKIESIQSVAPASGGGYAHGMKNPFRCEREILCAPEILQGFQRQIYKPNARGREKRLKGQDTYGMGLCGKQTKGETRSCQQAGGNRVPGSGHDPWQDQPWLRGNDGSKDSFSAATWTEHLPPMSHRRCPGYRVPRQHAPLGGWPGQSAPRGALGENRATWLRTGGATPFPAYTPPGTIETQTGLC